MVIQNIANTPNLPCTYFFSSLFFSLKSKQCVYQVQVAMYDSIFLTIE